jgi:hypothetical protein
MDGYEPHQDSTYALTLYRYNTEIEGKPVAVGIVEHYLVTAVVSFLSVDRFLGHCRTRTLRQPSSIILLRRTRVHPRNNHTWEAIWECAHFFFCFLGV